MMWHLNKSQNVGSFWKWLPVLFVSVSMISMVGCGGDTGPKRYDLTGSVTFDGQPIPAGSIVFQPDTAKGNSGPQGIAMIRNGKYDTAAEGGKGVIGGPHIVRIVGLERESQGEEDIIQALFSEYQLEAELPSENGSQDFEVPADAPAAPKVVEGDV